MDVAAAVIPWLACAVLLGAVILCVRQLRTEEALYDLQVGIYLWSPIRRALGTAVLLFTSALHAALGVAFLSTGDSFAWAFFPLAAVPLVLLGFYAYVASLPLDYPREDEPRSAGDA